MQLSTKRPVINNTVITEFSESLCVDDLHIEGTGRAPHTMGAITAGHCPDDGEQGSSPKSYMTYELHLRVVI